MKSWETAAAVLILLSAIAILLAIIGSFGLDIWLASTQWLLVAIALALYGVFAKLSEKK